MTIKDLKTALENVPDDYPVRLIYDGYDISDNDQTQDAQDMFVVSGSTEPCLNGLYIHNGYAED